MAINTTVALQTVIELIHKTYRIETHGTLTQLLMEVGDMGC